MSSRMTRVLIGIALTLPLVGCGQRLPRNVRCFEGQVDDKTGKLVACWLKHQKWPTRVEYEEAWAPSHDYAALILWSNKPDRFYLYDSPHRRVYETTDFQAFLKVMDRVPAKAKVEWINGCGGPYFGMPNEERDRFKTVVTANGRQLAEDGFPLCTCETYGVRYPEPRLK
jgi:hypothetical protein